MFSSLLNILSTEAEAFWYNVTGAGEVASSTALATEPNSARSLSGEQISNASQAPPTIKTTSAITQKSPARPAASGEPHRKTSNTQLRPLVLESTRVTKQPKGPITRLKGKRSVPKSQPNNGTVDAGPSLPFLSTRMPGELRSLSPSPAPEADPSLEKHVRFAPEVMSPAPRLRRASMSASTSGETRAFPQRRVSQDDASIHTGARQGWARERIQALERLAATSSSPTMSASTAIPQLAIQGPSPVRRSDQPSSSGSVSQPHSTSAGSGRNNNRPPSERVIRQNPGDLPREVGPSRLGRGSIATTDSHSSIPRSSSADAMTVSPDILPAELSLATAKRKSVAPLPAQYPSNISGEQVHRSVSESSLQVKQKGQKTTRERELEMRLEAELASKRDLERKLKMLESQVSQRSSQSSSVSWDPRPPPPPPPPPPAPSWSTRMPPMNAGRAVPSGATGPGNYLLEARAQLKHTPPKGAESRGPPMPRPTIISMAPAGFLDELKNAKLRKAPNMADARSMLGVKRQRDDTNDLQSALHEAIRQRFRDQPSEDSGISPSTSSGDISEPPSLDRGSSLDHSVDDSSQLATPPVLPVDYAAYSRQDNPDEEDDNEESRPVKRRRSDIPKVPVMTSDEPSARQKRVQHVSRLEGRTTSPMPSIGAKSKPKAKRSSRGGRRASEVSSPARATSADVDMADDDDPMALSYSPPSQTNRRRPTYAEELRIVRERAALAEQKARYEYEDDMEVDEDAVMVSRRAAAEPRDETVRSHGKPVFRTVVSDPLALQGFLGSPTTWAARPR